MFAAEKYNFNFETISIETMQNFQHIRSNNPNFFVCPQPTQSTSIDYFTTDRLSYISVTVKMYITPPRLFARKLKFFGKWWESKIFSNNLLTSESYNFLHICTQ
jgi:hypothetical protein